MNEAYLRKWHRRMGIVLALFVFLQAVSGVVLNLEDIFDIPVILAWATILHRGGGMVGTIYRTLLGLALMGMAMSGTLIFFKVWQRNRKF